MMCPETCLPEATSMCVGGSIGCMKARSAALHVGTYQVWTAAKFVSPGPCRDPEKSPCNSGIRSPGEEKPTSF